jgi:multidrug efflux pump subunit AcrB
MQAPLARTVLGGLSAATLITLIYIPVMYVLFNSRKRCIRKDVVDPVESVA